MGLEISLPDGVGPTLGLLCDSDIKDAVKRGYLFEQVGFTQSNAKYASYEIRVGHQYEVLKFDGDDVVHVPKELTDGRSIDVPPGSTFLIVAERTKSPVRGAEARRVRSANRQGEP
jgi:hypothetical protein